MIVRPYIVYLHGLTIIHKIFFHSNEQLNTPDEHLSISSSVKSNSILITNLDINKQLKTPDDYQNISNIINSKYRSILDQYVNKSLKNPGARQNISNNINCISRSKLELDGKSQYKIDKGQQTSIVKKSRQNELYQCVKII
jgi:hypothetical protein